MRRAPLVLGLCMLLAGGIYGIVQTAEAVGREDPPATLIAVGFTVWTLGVLAGLVVGRLRSHRLVGEVEESGITFRADTVATVLLGFSFAGAAMTFGLLLVYRGRDGAPLPFSTADRLNQPAVLSTLLVLSLLCVAAILVHGRGRLRLTPMEIENIEVLAVRTASWDDVTDVTDTAPQFRGGKAISIHIRDVRKPFAIGNASGYATNGAALYWMIRHYWLHPENRGELADGRALERLRNENFPIE
ncbi:hypothetical protein CRI77_16165 [Mycolicibacterium duvalii]|nr:hypothetical protein CRI77_16165 [Mycolicibacterium duvalii]